MKIAVVGSRKVDDREFIFKSLSTFPERVGIITEIVSGGADGVDSIAEEWAKANGIPVKIFLPDYGKYGGKVAPYKRNVEIWDYADAGIAFWDGVSPGTKQSFDISRERGKLLMLFMIGSDGTVRYTELNT